MAMLTPEDVKGMLDKIIEKAVSGNVEQKQESNTDLKDIKNAIAGLTDFVSKNVKIEKPKTMEEVVAETVQKTLKDAGLIKEQSEANKNDESVNEDDKPVTMKQLKELLAKKPVAEKGQKAPDAIELLVKSIAKENGLTDDDLTDENDENDTPAAKDEQTEREFTCDAVDAQGNDIAKEKREKIQDLDDFIGGMVQNIKSAKDED